MILETTDDGLHYGCLVDPKVDRRTDSSFSFRGGNRGTEMYL